MAQIFPPSSNTLSKASVVGGVLAVLLGLAAVDRLGRSPYVTRASVPRQQPVPFSHKHHVGGVGIDCRYCHTSVEESAFAGIPSVHTCMACHSQLWSDTPMLDPVRQAFRTDGSVEWVRVHDMPDFVYFDHSIHVSKGVGCTTCHGSVEQMPLVWQEESLQMQWCLECHRAPEKFIRPPEEVFSVAWEPPANQQEIGARLVEDYDIQKEQLTNCSVCHR
jgi:hypothetical protein